MDVLIGLEIHVQLKTKSKLFCGCSTDYRDSPPNTHTCPTCLGHPGTLPKLNKRVIDFGIKAGLAFNCDISKKMRFHRKNYFYPDLPKGYQITQYDTPLAKKGKIRVNGNEVRVRRIHIEEDPGRLVHKKHRFSLVDYNRSGIPLLEIVTEPDISSPEEAKKLLLKIRETLEYLEIFDGSLDGSMRCDANISLKGGKRVEVKNISSYKGAQKALAYEITRQKNLIRRGKDVERETRHFDEAQEITTAMRKKEEEHDYRYFPEPDLPLVKTNEKKIKKIKESLPELPEEKRERFVKEFGITSDQAVSLTSSLDFANFFEEVAESVDPELAASWSTDVLKGELNYRDVHISESNIGVGEMIDILNYLSADKITEKGATHIIRKVLDNNEKPSEIMKKDDLRSIDEKNIKKIVKKVIDENQDAVDDYKKGKKEVVNYLVGQVMKETKGRAKPDITNQVVKDMLEENL